MLVLKTDVVTLGQVELTAAAGERFFFERLVNMQGVVGLVFHVQGITNVVVNLHVTGAFEDSPQNADGLFLVGDGVPYGGVASGRRASVPVDLSRYWHPWMGLMVILPTAQANVARVLATAYIHRWVDDRR